MEVGAKGVAEMVKKVYAGAEAETENIEQQEELNGKLERSLGIKLQTAVNEERDEETERDEEPPPAQQRSRRSRKQAAPNEDSDD